mmetsp:Transcript_55170/g.175521  ORF Transcript_55170/g.175521 Transcript_55170/m.175521 type:complete len:324 (+) Transcript_55170:666-1637(+)
MYPRSTWLFVGDSINGNLWLGLLCGLARGGLLYRDDRGAGVTAKAWETNYVRLRGPDSPFGRLMRAQQSRETEGIRNNPIIMPEVEVTWICMSMPKFNRTQLANALRHVDVVVVNLGAHYGQEREDLTMYRRSMKDLFQVLADWSRQSGNFAVWRDTSAQHFHGTGAFSNIEQARTGNECKCHPIPRSQRGTGNHIFNLNFIARSAADRQNNLTPGAIGFLDMYELTKNRHDMHEENQCGYNALTHHRAASPGRTDKQIFDALSDDEVRGMMGMLMCCDCTHWCYSPLFYDHVATGIYEAVRGQMKGRDFAVAPAPARQRPRS